MAAHCALFWRSTSGTRERLRCFYMPTVIAIAEFANSAMKTTLAGAISHTLMKLGKLCRLYQPSGLSAFRMAACSGYNG